MEVTVVRHDCVFEGVLIRYERSPAFPMGSLDAVLTFPHTPGTMGVSGDVFATPRALEFFGGIEEVLASRMAPIASTGQVAGHRVLRLNWKDGGSGGARGDVILHQVETEQGAEVVCGRLLPALINIVQQGHGRERDDWSLQVVRRGCGMVQVSDCSRRFFRAGLAVANPTKQSSKRIPGIHIWRA